MVKVLNDGAKGSNIQRREIGERSIPTSFNLLELKRRPARAPYVEVEKIRSLQCVTYVANPSARSEDSCTGFYINVYPWVPWRQGKRVTKQYLYDGDRAPILTEEQRNLRKPLKKAGDLASPSFSTLMTRYDNRCNFLKELGLNVKQTMAVVFEY